MNCFSAYMLADKRKAKDFREDCMASFEWSENTFYNRIKGYGFKTLERKEFEKKFVRYFNQPLIF